MSAWLSGDVNGISYLLLLTMLIIVILAKITDRKDRP